MKTLFTSFLLLPFLFGCIFGKEKQNENEVSNQGPVLGIVQMADRRATVGAQSAMENSVQAIFARRTSVMRSLLNSDSNEREATCTSVDPKAAAQGKAVGVGQLSLTLGQQVLEIPFVAKDLSYSGTLNKGQVWPKGVYPFKASGSKDALAFEVSLSMPGLLEDVTVNGDPITQAIAINEKGTVDVAWKVQSETSAHDIMGVEMSGKSGGSKVGFYCEIKESETNGSWRVPQAWVDKLPVGLTDARIFVYRQHLAKQTGTSIESITVHGMRELQAGLTIN